MTSKRLRMGCLKRTNSNRADIMQHQWIWALQVVVSFQSFFSPIFRHWKTSGFKVCLLRNPATLGVTDEMPPWWRLCQSAEADLWAGRDAARKIQGRPQDVDSAAKTRKRDEGNVRNVGSCEDFFQGFFLDFLRTLLYSTWILEGKGCVLFF